LDTVNHWHEECAGNQSHYGWRGEFGREGGASSKSSFGVRVHWVQPKVLDVDSIKQLRERLDEWQVKVSHVGQVSVKDAGELMVN